MGTEHSVSSPSEIELIDDRILVRYLEPEEITKHGIYLLKSTVAEKQEAVQAGEVINVGPGRFTGSGEREAMMDIQVGDIVFFPKFLGYSLFIPDPEMGEEVEYKVFGQHDLFGVKKVGRGKRWFEGGSDLMP